MNNIDKKIPEEFHIFGKYWDSNWPTYLILPKHWPLKKSGSNIADQNLNCNYKFVWN